jgi:hypothetical protein
MLAAACVSGRGAGYLLLLIEEERVEVCAVALGDADQNALADEAAELVGALHVEPLPGDAGVRSLR